MPRYPSPGVLQEGCRSWESRDRALSNLKCRHAEDSEVRESSHFANVICGPAVGVDMDPGFSGVIGLLCETDSLPAELPGVLVG